MTIQKLVAGTSFKDPSASSGPQIAEAVNALIDFSDAVADGTADVGNAKAADLSKATINVPSLKALASIQVGQRRTGVTYRVMEFNTGTGIGGHDLRWNPTKAWTSADIGIVWPDVALNAWDGTAAGLSALYGSFTAGNGCWERIDLVGTANKELNPDSLGAIGDDATNDFISLNRCSELSKTHSYVNSFSPKSYFIAENTLPIYSGTCYVGIQGRTWVRGLKPNAAVIASAAYLALETPGGRPVMKSVGITGGLTTGDTISGQLAFIYHDYWGTFEDIEVRGCSAGGIRMTSRNINNIAPSGTLVESKFVRPIVRNCGGTLFYGGEDNNNKLTDCWLIDPILQGNASCERHLYIGSSAGWFVKNYHGYGGASVLPIELRNCFNTEINGYEENIGLTTGAVIHLQRNCKIDLRMNGGDSFPSSSGRYVRVDSVGFVTDANIQGTLQIYHTSSSSAVGAFINGTNIVSDINVLTGGPNAALVKNYDAVSADVLRNKVLQYDKIRQDASNALRFNDVALAYSYRSRHTANNPSVVKSVNFPIKSIPNFRGMLGTLSIFTRQNDDATIRSRYVGSVNILAKNATTWTVDLFDLLAPIGFAAAPALAITANGDGSGVLNLTYQVSDTDGNGEIQLILGAAGAPTT